MLRVVLQQPALCFCVLPALSCRENERPHLPTELSIRALFSLTSTVEPHKHISKYWDAYTLGDSLHITVSAHVDVSQAG